MKKILKTVKTVAASTIDDVFLLGLKKNKGTETPDSPVGEIDKPQLIKKVITVTIPILLLLLDMLNIVEIDTVKQIAAPIVEALAAVF